MYSMCCAQKTSLMVTPTYHSPTKWEKVCIEWHDRLIVQHDTATKPLYHPQPYSMISIMLLQYTWSAQMWQVNK